MTAPESSGRRRRRERAVKVPLTEAAPLTEAPVPHSVARGADAAVRIGLRPSEIAAALRDPATVLWVDLDGRVPEQHALLQRIFRFHPLAVEDTLNPNSRIKVEEYPGYLFTIVRGVRYDEATEDPYDLETFNLYFFLGGNYLVTVRSAERTACDELWPRVTGSPDVFLRGPGRVMHAIVDQAVDDYFPVLDRLDDFIDDLEERVFVEQDREAVRTIFSLKRLVLSLRRHLVPEREVMSVLANRPSPLLAPDTQVYFRDVYDHVLRITDSLDTYRELLSSTLDSSLTQTSNRLATVTKTLSVLATLSIPFVVVSGMWGMNFGRVPLQDHPVGFWLMLVLQLALGAIMVAGLRWRGLL